ncbi:MAG: inositol monophosphatase family protein [Candidatus Doudnabacteria bacterium]
MTRTTLFNFFKNTLPVLAECGHYALNIQNRVRAQKNKFSCDHDPFAMALTDADITIQEILLAHFLAEGYHFQVFTEEADKSLNVRYFPPKDNVIVGIDPIDGTLHYKKNLPLFRIILTVFIKGKLEGALIHTPYDQKFYCAIQKLPKSLVFTPASQKGKYIQENLTFSKKGVNIVLTYKLSSRRVQRIKEAGLEVIQMGKDDLQRLKTPTSFFKGEIDAFFRDNAFALDWGPFALIAEKAGAIVSEFNGHQKDIYQYWCRRDGYQDSRVPSLLVSKNKKIHNKLVGLLR